MWSGALWVMRGSGLIGGVWVAIFSVELFKGWCLLSL